MCSSTIKGHAVSQTRVAAHPKSNERSQCYWLFLFLSFFLLSNSINAQRANTKDRVLSQPAALVTACDAPPAPDPACTPPSSYDVDINLTGGTLIWNESHPQLGDCQDFKAVARITGCGTVLIPNSLNLQFKSSGATLVIDGPDLIVNGGSLQLDESGSKFLMNGGALRIFGNFQQTGNTVQCITGTSIEVGEESASEGFTEGKFNSSSNTQSASNWQNDGGYRYLKDCCINVTQDYQLQSSGSGSGINGVDVIINCCIEIGDRGSSNATSTAFGVSDGNDSGNFQNSNRMYIFDTDIVVANGDFQNSNNTMTACNMDVKLNKSGNFQINSGTLEGDGLCIAAEDQIENSGTWTANISSWYSDKNNSLTENNPITGTKPAESNSVPDCFEGCCLEDDCAIPDPVIVVTCDDKGNTDPADDEYSYTIQVANPDPGCSAGSFSITGADSESGLSYDQVHGPYGPFSVSSGSLSITITDDNNSNCSSDAEVIPDCGCPAGTSPTYSAGVISDGNFGEWDLTNDFFANMYEAGNPTKQLLSKAYLRYDCSTNTLCVLVLTEIDVTADQVADEAWVKVYDISNSTQIDGTSSDFAWVPNQMGWEGCFSLAEAFYNEIEIHVKVTWDGESGRTSSTGKGGQGNAIPLCIECPDDPCLGKDCDDGCPYTVDTCDPNTGECINTLVEPDCDDQDCTTNDYYDADNCECVNEPITPPSCDDQDCTTNDYYDTDICECVNEPITPPSCDDQDCTTNDYYDTDICECVNEPITPPSCDDQDCTTNDYYDTDICECVNEPITPPSCDDQDCTTNDYYDTDICECVNEPITPPSCDDQDCTTNDYYDTDLCECVNEPITPTSCDDQDCTTNDYYDTDICECVNEPITPPSCDDQDCTTNDYYDTDICECVNEPITPPSCDDQDCTTNDYYDTDICECVNEPITPPSCDDQDCTTNDYYDTDICECVNEPITSPSCDDQDCTTNDYYDTDICECVNEPITPPSCDDQDCTTNDYYDTDLCECVNEPITPPSCDDQDCTTNDYYDTDICECVNEPITSPSCDDQDCTTNDYYDTDICECVNEPITPPSCDDQDCTTNDYYDTDLCECVNEPITPPSCDDQDCTTNDYYDTDICECVNEPITPPSCDDQDCTTNDYYDTDICECVNEPITPPSCDDQDCTTNDYYDTDVCECVNEPITPPSCDDQDCTTNDYYDTDICECVNEPITPPSCDDQDCTTNDYYDTDICECVNEPITPPSCDDQDCTTNDYYDTDICECVNEPITPPSCDDQDCTTNDYYDTDVCECVNEPITSPSCDDQDCTTNDYYDTDICECVNEPITPPSCDDGSACTRDYYDTANCECVNEPIVCDDGDPCTLDYCDPDLGCVFEPIDDLSCGDGTIDCEGQTEATYDPETDRYTLYANGCWHDCLQPDRDVHFYQELCGDGQLIAHVASITGSGHAGVVMREGLDPVGRRVGAMTKLYSNTIRREYREAYGAPVHQMPAFRPGVEWFRMIRKGNQVKVYTSERGDYWRLFYKVTYPNLASCLNVGLMAYSSSGGTEITAVFDNVQVIPAINSFRPMEEIFVPGKLTAQDQILTQYGQNDPRVKIEVSSDLESVQKLAVFPNPAKDEAFVTIPRFERGEQALLVLYNSTGQEVWRKGVDAGRSRTEWLSLSELDAGVYVIRLVVEGEKGLSQRLVISK